MCTICDAPVFRHTLTNVRLPTGTLKIVQPLLTTSSTAGVKVTTGKIMDKRLRFTCRPQCCTVTNVKHNVQVKGDVLYTMSYTYDQNIE